MRPQHNPHRGQSIRPGSASPLWGHAAPRHFLSFLQGAPRPPWRQKSWTPPWCKSSEFHFLLLLLLFSFNFLYRFPHFLGRQLAAPTPAPLFPSPRPAPRSPSTTPRKGSTAGPAASAPPPPPPAQRHFPSPPPPPAAACSSTPGSQPPKNRHGTTWAIRGGLSGTAGCCERIGMSGAG